MDNKILGAIITAVIVVMLFSFVPAIGEVTDNSWSPEAQAKATGTLTLSGQPADGDNVTVGADVYEFDDNASVTEGNELVDIGGTLELTLDAFTVSANINDTEGVLYANTATTVTLEADAYGTDGNDIATTDSCSVGSFATATLAGGADGTQWDSATNTDIPTGYELWSTVGGVVTLVVILSLIVIAIAKITKMTK